MRLDEDDLDLIATRVVEMLENRHLAGAQLGNNQLGYTEEQAAELMGIPKNTLRERRLAGDIKAKLVGRRYLYARSALVDYLAD